MANIFLVGATGGVGSRLLPLLTRAGHKVTALHRNDTRAAALAEQGAHAVCGDLMTLTADDLTRMSEGADVLVFSAGAAGSGLERTAEIDGNGPLKLIEAARRNGISRFYLVSAMPEAGRGKAPNERFEFYMRTKKQADAALVNSDLDWVILRPGTLLHEDADDQVTLSPALNYGSVKRGNVAAVLAKLIDTPAIKRQILELTDGQNSVAEAVARWA